MPPLSPVVFGLWPLAGITTIGVTDRDVAQTLDAAISAGITRFDTAFSYGYDGRSDRALSRAIADSRNSYEVFGKVGQRYDANRQRVIDGRPTTLIRDAETSLARLQIDFFDVLFLHCPDPQVELATSAEAIAELQRRGLCKRIGVCNVTVDQYREFRDAVGCDAIQCPLNLLQTESLDHLIATCRHDGCEVYTFWTLMKGLLAGAITRDHVFAEGDSRPGYDIFQGSKRQAAHDLVDQLAELARRHDRTTAQLVIGWVLSQPGVTGALVGGRKPEQIIETAHSTPLSEDLLGQVERLVAPMRPTF